MRTRLPSTGLNAKRLFDVAASVLGLIALGPLLGLIALAVRLTDGSPVLFRQVRVGCRGKDFTLVKFRTMRTKAGTERGAFDAGGSVRTTPFGRLLRRTKLDELPQLWNVLRGDMSLVGPRPEIRPWVDAYPDRWARVLAVRPGITDPASIVYRHEETLLAKAANPVDAYRATVLPAKLDLYESYVRNRSFMGDIRILFRTLRALAR